MKLHTWVINLLFAATLSFLPSAAVADVVTIGALKDTTIFSESENTFGGGEVFLVGNNNATGPTGNSRRGLVQFDLTASVPAGATINGVMVTLHLDGATTLAADREVAIHRLVADWGDGTTGSGGAGGGSGMGAAPADDDVTWNFRSYSVSPPVPPLVSWATPGGDFAAASATAIVSPTVGFYSWTSAGLIADVHYWLDNPAMNFGWIVRGPETTKQSQLRFDSKDRSVADFQPALSIDYTAVPEPRGLALAALGSIALAAFLRRPSAVCHSLNSSSIRKIE